MATKIAPEPDWNTAYNPDVLLNIICPPAMWPATPVPPTAATVRRFGLFGVACARMVWELLSTDARNAVVIRERFADGLATPGDVSASAVRFGRGTPFAHLHALNAVASINREPSDTARAAAKALATHAAGPAPPGGNPVAKEWQVAWNRTFSEAREYQAELVRDIFPPPGYAPRIDPDWLTDTVVALARGMDASGDFSAVPILADALQDAGCADAVMLDRCRAPSWVHCRGNWVVDSVLGRE